MLRRRALVLTGTRQTGFVETDLPDPGADEVLIESHLSSIKSGTERHIYRQEGVFQHRVLDPQLRVFVPATHAPPLPRAMGNMTVGEVVEVGKDVRGLRPGDIVFGWLPIADLHVVHYSKVYPLGKLTPAQALCVDPCFFALAAVRDAMLSVGTTVAILGLGAIGLFAVQFARMCGATVVATCSLPRRLDLARRFGADHVIQSSPDLDLGMEIKTWPRTRGGVDVAIECSGQSNPLNDAMRATAQRGLVVTVGFYSGDMDGLRLGEEFLHNALDLRASLPAWNWGNPDRQYPRWNQQRLKDTVIALLEAGRIDVEGIIDPVLSFEQAACAFRLIDRDPASVVKVGIKY